MNLDKKYYFILSLLIIIVISAGVWYSFVDNSEVEVNKMQENKTVTPNFSTFDHSYVKEWDNNRVIIKGRYSQISYSNNLTQFIDKQEKEEELKIDIGLKDENNNTYSGFIDEARNDPDIELPSPGNYDVKEGSPKKYTYEIEIKSFTQDKIVVNHIHGGKYVFTSGIQASANNPPLNKTFGTEDNVQNIELTNDKGVIEVSGIISGYTGGLNVSVNKTVKINKTLEVYVKTEDVNKDNHLNVPTSYNYKSQISNYGDIENIVIYHNNNRIYEESINT